jgi:hypothetical protein
MVATKDVKEKKEPKTLYFYSIVHGVKFLIGDRNPAGGHDPDLLDYVGFETVLTRINGDTVKRGVLEIAEDHKVVSRLQADPNVSEITKDQYETLKNGVQETLR